MQTSLMRPTDKRCNGIYLTYKLQSMTLGIWQLVSIAHIDAAVYQETAF